MGPTEFAYSKCGIKIALYNRRKLTLSISYKISLNDAYNAITFINFFNKMVRVPTFGTNVGIPSVGTLVRVQSVGTQK